MIAKIIGRINLLDGDKNLLLVETAAGVCYEVTCTPNTVASIQKTVPPALWTFLAVTPTEMRLYGFLSMEERQLFQLLISVNRVGPRAALLLLDKFAPKNITSAIAAGNTATLAVPGVGEKIASRIVLELQNKLTGSTLEEMTPSTDSDVTRGAESALINLSFSESEARSAVQAALKEEGADSLTISGLVGRCLALLRGNLA